MKWHDGISIQVLGNDEEFDGPYSYWHCLDTNMSEFNPSKFVLTSSEGRRPSAKRCFQAEVADQARSVAIKRRS